MNKKGNYSGGEVIVFIVFVIGVVLILQGGIYLTIKSGSNSERLNVFCLENGYDEAAGDLWSVSKCKKIEDNTIIEREVKKCGDEICFIERK